MLAVRARRNVFCSLRADFQGPLEKRLGLPVLAPRLVQETDPRQALGKIEAAAS
jgi:hypothetical protein